MSDPKCPWCKARVLCRPSADSVGADPPSLADPEALAIAFELPEPVAMVRLEDGSQVVAFAPAGLEVRALTAEDLDERGMPRCSHIRVRR